MKDNSKDKIKIKYPVLLFDDECLLCKRFKLALERMDIDKKLNFINLHEFEQYELNVELELSQLKEAIHLVDEDHNIFIGAEVIPYLAKSLPGIKKIAWLLDTGMGKKASEIFYHTVNELKNSKYNYCPKCK
jgi:predicted DCC family thiol-disulfide oxidoreductase YuxK